MNWSLLICSLVFLTAVPTCTPTLCAQDEAQTKQQERVVKPKPKPKRVRLEPKPPPRKLTVAEIEQNTVERLVDLVVKGNEQVQSYAFETLAENFKSKSLGVSLNDEQLKKVISAGLRSEDGGMVRGAFEMLDASKLADESKRGFLIRASGYDNRTARSEALDRLDKNKKAVLEQIISAIDAKPGDSHLDSIRLIEHWGADAKAAVPALLKHFEARYAKRRDRRFLELVYALAEIGPAAKDAGAIPLAAIKLRSGHKSVETAHQLAGILCLQRIKPIKESDTKEKGAKKTRSRDAQMISGLLGGSGGGIISGSGGVMGNVMGGRHPAATRYPGGDDVLGELLGGQTVRLIVEFNLESIAVADKKKDEKRHLVDRRVDLIFQNYDIYTDSSGGETNEPSLSLAELRTVEPPLLMREIDSDGDQKITKGELGTHLTENPSNEEVQRQEMLEFMRRQTSSRSSSSSRSGSRGGRGR